MIYHWFVLCSLCGRRETYRYNQNAQGAATLHTFWHLKRLRRVVPMVRFFVRSPWSPAALNLMPRVEAIHE